MSTNADAATPIHESERRLLDLIRGDDGRGPTTEPVEDDVDGGPEAPVMREVMRGSFLSAVLRGDHGPLPGTGLLLDDFDVEGDVDLSYADVTTPFRFSNCMFPEGITLHRATTKDVLIVDCEIGLPADDVEDGPAAAPAATDGDQSESDVEPVAPGAGLDAERAVVDGDLIVVGGQVHGVLSLPSVHVKGVMAVARSVVGRGFHEHWGVLLNDATIDGSVSLGPELDLDGGCSIAGAHIGGELELSGVTTPAAGTVAVRAAQVHVAKQVSISECRLEGPVIFASAQIGDSLTIVDSYVGMAGGAPGLDVDQCRIGSSLELVRTEIVNGVTAVLATVTGEVTVADHTVIGGTAGLVGLDLTSATLSGLFIRSQVNVDHGVSLSEAHISGSVFVTSSRLGPSAGAPDLGDAGAGLAGVVALAQNHALAAANAKIGGSVLIVETELDGVLNLAATSIDAVLRIQSSTVAASRMVVDGIEVVVSITIAGGRIGQDVALNGVRADGAMWMVAATVAASVGIQDCSFGADPPGGRSGASLVALGASTKQVVIARSRFAGSIVFDEAELKGVVVFQDVTCGRSEHEVALSCQGAKARGNLLLERVHARGRLQLSGLDATHDVVVSAVNVNSDHIGMVADRAVVGGSVRLQAGTMIGGKLQAQRSQIGGDVLLLGVGIRLGLDLFQAAIGGSLVIAGRCALGSRRPVPVFALDLQQATVGGSVIVRARSTLAGIVDGTSCRIGGLLRMTESSVGVPGRGVLLGSATVGKDLELGPELEVIGTVDVTGTHVAGNVAVTVARVRTAPDGVLPPPGASAAGIVGSGFQVDRSFVVARTELDGPIALGLATIGGDTHIIESRTGSSTLSAATETIAVGIHLGQSRIGGDLMLSNVVTAGPLSLPGVAVAGVVFLAGGTMGSAAVSGAVPSVSGAVFLDHAQTRAIFVNGTTLNGRTSLDHATVTGDVVLVGITVHDTTTGYSVTGVGLRVDSRLLIGNGSTLEGTLLLDGTVVRADLILQNVTIHGGTSPEEDDRSPRRAMVADGAEVFGHVVITAVTFDAPVHLDSMDIHDDLILENVRIDGDARWALLLDGSTLRGNLQMQALDVSGGTSLDDVQVQGDVMVGQLRCTAAPPVPSLAARRATIAGRLTLHPMTTGGPVDLSEAHVGVLDDRPDTWPQVASVRVAGLRVDRLDADERAGASWTAKSRRRWLDGAETSGSAPYRMLADLYEQTGDDGAARVLRIAGARRRASPLTRLTLGWLGYGYRLVAAVIPFVIALALVLIVLYWQRASDHFAPTDNAVAGQVTSSECDESVYPCLQPVGYALDVLVPVVDFDEQSAWRPTVTWLRIFLWMATASGWLLTTLLVIAFTNRFRG